MTDTPDPHSLYVITGDEPLLVGRAVESVVNAVLKRCGPPQLNYASFRASEPNAGQAIAAARTLPMMAPVRLVVLQEMELLDEDVMTALVEYAMAPADTAVFVVTGSGAPKTRKGGKNWGVRLRNAVNKADGAVWRKYAATDASPGRFAAEQAKALGHDLSTRNANLLVELVGRDLSLLAQEVEKLGLFVEAGAPIEAADIHAVCSMVSEAVVWDLTAGLASRDPEQALGALHRLLEDGDAAHRLLALITWQYRTLLQMAAMVRRGVRDDAIRRELRIRPDLFRRVRGQVGQLPRAADVLDRIAMANRDMNSHRAGDRRVLEDLVVGLCV